MIQATFNYHHHQITGFQLKGHANAGEYGNDIVCAAVSALAINTVNSLEQLTHVKFHLIQDSENGGLMAVNIDHTHFNDEKAHLLLESLKLGLCEIEKSYGKYVQVN